MYMRHYDEAIAELHRILALDGNFDLARGFFIRTLLAKGACAQAIDELKVRAILTMGSEGFRGQALALCGEIDEARAELARILELSKTQFVSAHSIAMIYAALRDADNTLRWMDRALAERAPLSPQWLSIRCSTFFMTIRDSPSSYNALGYIASNLSAVDRRKRVKAISRSVYRLPLWSCASRGLSPLASERAREIARLIRVAQRMTGRGRRRQAQCRDNPLSATPATLRPQHARQTTAELGLPCS